MPTEDQPDDCPRHQGESITARCVRFDRRFCEQDFKSPEPPECLSPESYCRYRPQCLVWVRFRERRRRAG